MNGKWWGVLLINFLYVSLFSQVDSVSQLQEVIVNGDAVQIKVNDVSPMLRIQTPLLNIPQNIQVITSKLLREQQIYDMLEGVTRNVSGATRKNDWEIVANVVMRGATIPAFRNGMNVQSFSGPLAEDMSVVDRIEFVKGPTGFMLANGDPAGFYNVVTKKPTGVIRGEATLSLGSFDLYRAALDLDGKLNSSGKLLYRFNIMGQLKNSHIRYDFNNRLTVAPVLAYHFNENTSLTVEYTYQSMSMAMIGAANVFSPKKYGELPKNFSTLEPNLAPTTIKDQSLFVTGKHRINDQWKFTAQLAYLNYNQTGSSMWLSDMQPNGDIVRSISNWDAFNESRLGQAFLNGELITGTIKHKVLTGLDMGYKNYYADFYQTSLLGGFDYYSNPLTFNIYQPVHGIVPPDDLPQFNRSRSLRERGGGTIGESYRSVYLQDELSFFKDMLRLTLAGRYTHITQGYFGTDSDDGRFTPRAGLSLSVNKQLSVYILYDQAFVAQQGIDSVRKKPFVPVTGNNLEAGIKKDFAEGRWNATVSVYTITRNNVVASLPGRPGAYVQTGQSKTKGVELDVRGEISRGLNLTFNYAYTSAKVSRDEVAEKIGKLVPGSAFPEHGTNTWISYQVPGGKIKGFGAAVGYQYQLNRKVYTSRTTGPEPEKLPDYFRLDSRLSWTANQFSVGLNVNNLLNTTLYSGFPYEFDYNPATVEYYYQTEPGINFRLSFGYKF